MKRKGESERAIGREGEELRIEKIKEKLRTENQEPVGRENG